MRQFILGSGIVGLLARFILGDSWQLIPFGRSRFYSFNTPLADNHIIRTNKIDAVLTDLGYSKATVHYQRVFSYIGQLIFSGESFVKQAFIEKLFGGSQHPLADKLLRTADEVYQVKITDLYQGLMAAYTNEIRTSLETYGALQSIGEHTLITQNQTLEFDRVVSAIPLDHLYGLMGTSYDLPARDLWYYHVKTSSIDLEGANEALVVDGPFDFYKVTNIRPDEYIFHCLRDLVNPTDYLSAFIGTEFKLLNSTTMQRALPVGAPPRLEILENNGIYPVGCHGQWDYFMDIASGVNRLVKCL